jgi:hypothetical protein
VIPVFDRRSNGMKWFAYIAAACKQADKRDLYLNCDSVVRTAIASFVSRDRTQLLAPYYTPQANKGHVSHVGCI